jgi:membrane protease YdiL (CAAX protease family)
VPTSARVKALLEVLICSGYPTQFLVLGTLWSAGLGQRGPDAQLSLAFVAALSLGDAILLIGLVLFFLISGGERPRDVFLGARPVLPEAGRGILLIPVSFLIAATIIVAARSLVPWLHNVPVNPFEGMMQTRGQQVVLGFVVMVAGGLREEIQRAFILHRFGQSLGGAWFGLAVFSVAFGLGHLQQGRDVAIATAALGAFWGAVYLVRRSIVSPAIAHAGFNASEILRFAVVNH